MPEFGTDDFCKEERRHIQDVEKKEENTRVADTPTKDTISQNPYQVSNDNHNSSRQPATYIYRECLECGSLMRVPRWKVLKGRGKYCNVSCMSKAFSNYESEEDRRDATREYNREYYRNKRSTKHGDGTPNKDEGAATS